MLTQQLVAHVTVSFAWRLKVMINLLSNHFTTCHQQPFRKAEFVIEAAPEDEEIKKTIFRKLDQVSKLEVVSVLS